MDGDAAAKAALTDAVRSSRGDLESEDPRRRLGVLLRLVAACQESKTQQHAVGALLREPVARAHACGYKKLLEVVLGDLRSVDRTLRCAAARLVCHLAYENLVNQESIMQHSGGFSVGWLHVFAVPQMCTEPAKAFEPVSRRANSQRGLLAFLQSAVVDQYADVYKRVSEYYANGCHSFLPLCWRHPGPDDQSERDVLISDEVPDPADHLVGFYLVPRQTQFLEQDDFYKDEIMRSMDASDRQRLQALRSAFERVALVAHRGCESSDLTASAAAVAHYCSTLVQDEDKSLEWFTSVTGACGPTLGAYFDSADGTRVVTWTDVFVFASMQLNAAKLIELHGAEALEVLISIFLKCSLTEDDHLTSSTNVWAPVFVSIIQHDKGLAVELKRQIRALGVIPTLSKEENDWRIALRFKLEQLTPVSWAVFLAQWRAAAELDRRFGEQQSNTPPQHTTSVCSVSHLRRSIVEQLRPGSYKDLDELRRELPMVYRSASQVNLRNTSSKSLSVFQEEESPEDEVAIGTSCGRMGGKQDEEKAAEDAESLEYNLALFQRMQQSMAELDELSMQKLEEKKREKARVWDTVALNKKRTEEEEERRRLHMDEKHRGLSSKLAELEHRKTLLRAKANERKQRKHEQVARKRQQLDAEMEAKKHEMAVKLMRERQQRVLQLPRRPTTERLIRDETTYHHPMPPPPDTSRRPQPARLPASSSLVALATPKQPIQAVAETPEPPAPEILRQRALLYGQVVSKIYIADATNRSPPPQATPEVVQPHHLTRSFSVYSMGSFNVKAPVIKVTPPTSRSRRPSSYRRGLYSGRQKASHAPPESDDEPRDEQDDEDEIKSSRTHHSSGSPTTPRSPRRSPRRAPLEDQPNACSTLVMRNAALAVSERIRIPEVPAPVVEAPSVPPYVIAAQYEALDDQHKRNFRQRFNLKCVSHRLSYAVLKQYTNIVRRDMAWQAFHDKAAPNSQKIKYVDYVGVAQSLGIAMSDKKLLAVARQLDEKKSGTVEWKAFYTWWSMQYNDNVK